MSGAPASILIVRLSSIGDVVHTLPAFMSLRRSLPGTRIGWAVESAAAGLVRSLPGPLCVHEIPAQQWRRALLSPSTWRSMAAVRAEIRGAKYDVAIDFQGLVKSALVARLSGAEALGLHGSDARERPATWMYSRTPEPAPPGHIVHRSLHLASLVGAATERVEFPDLYGDADAERIDAELATRGLESFVVVHSAANWDSKQYEPGRWAAVGRGVHERTGLPVVWIWGPGERESTAALAEEAGPGNHLAFSTTLPQLAALIGRAQLFVGGDSAPLHIAVACGTRVVALFGPTDPARLGPLAPEDRVVCETLSCSHCHRRRCPLGTRQCLEDIRPEALVEAAIGRLQGRAGPAPFVQESIR